MLLGKRVVLRQIRSDDLPAMREWFRDRDVASTWARHPVISERHFEDDLEGRFASFDRDGHFMIEDEQGQAIGRIDFDDLDPIDRTAEISILLGPAQSRGKGYGTDAMHTIMEHLFNDRQIEKICLTVIAFNAPAIKLYEKLGFVLEGTKKETVWVNGEWHDLLVMGVLKSEYLGRA